MGQVIKNPKLFREMSEPIADKESAEKATVGFFEEVKAAREKYHLKNVAIVIECCYLSDGEEQDTFSLSMIGDSSAAEAMFAYGFGAMKTDRDAFIAKLIKGTK